MSGELESFSAWNLFLPPFNKADDTLVELFRLFPEQRMAAVFKNLCLGAGDVFSHPGTSVHIEDLAFLGAADQGGKLVVGCNEWHGPTSCEIKMEDSEISISQGKTAENREGNGGKNEYKFFLVLKQTKK